ncbi:helix-turn-helix domain-containing protein [Shinella pollutisoli]|uniref:Helix-turn-helix domain-containing protein n=1 Tax=Shinella pollutisoli TaxID=2250594 RepID=A0ABV7DCM3_9HYPH
MTSAIDIKSLRECRGWSQQELAEHLGVDQATVSRLERGAEPSGPVAKLLRLISASPAQRPDIFGHRPEGER